jgi:two-component system chemotaxis response regulator CheY
VKPRILIVDDDDTIRELVAMALEDEGYATAEACHGLEALDVVGRTPVDLILLDMRMPLMDGAGFARAYHEGPGPHAPIIVFTAGRNPGDAAAQTQAIGYLTKPFELDRLLALVAKAVGGPAPA